MKRSGLVMAIYLVGPDDKTLFKKRTTWDFLPALQAAEDGDVIELKGNYSPISEFNQIIISKSITIQGSDTLNENGQKQISNIFCQVFVEQGANLTLKNVLIRSNTEKTNCLHVKDGSVVTLDNVIIENTAEVGEVYPVVYAENKARLMFNEVLINSCANQQANQDIYITDSNLKLSNSTINGRLQIFNQSLLLTENVIVRNYTSNALNSAGNSRVILENSTFEGGAQIKDDNYPCVRLSHTNFKSNEVCIHQPNVSYALNTDHSELIITNSEISSANFGTSNVRVENTTFCDSLFIKDNTKLTSKSFNILGRDNGKINLFVAEKSEIECGQINFGKITSPNIKLENNVEFNVTDLNVFRFDEDSNYFFKNENNQFVKVDQDFKTEYFGEKTAYQTLNEMIGIHNAKSDIEEFIAIAEMNKKRRDQGLSDSVFTLHSLFLGNPGTGKTTVARIVGQLLYEKGIIEKNIFKEVSRRDLVGEYIGHTAVKTREVLDSAKGGVLFIDEAYTLNSGGERDFGLEAINEILTFMENNRENIVIIFAGYTNEMNNFLNSNEGLRSRIPNDFYFEDYTEDELIQIGLIDLHKQNYEVDEETYKKLIYHTFANSNDSSNGRWVRNLNEKILRKFALRISKDKSADISKILDEDLLALM